MKSFLLIGCLMALTGPAMRAQNPVDATEAMIWKSASADTDSIALLHSFKAGRLQGNARYIFMTTQNRSVYSDYYANAFSGAIKYSSAIYHGFSFAVSGSALYNLGSSNFTHPDEASNQPNRYEAGLFDILHPSNKGLLLRPEELSVRYKGKKLLIVAGRQLMNTPFINIQDGRMRPTEVQGIYLNRRFKDLNIEAAYINAIAPRSTLKWYSVDESIGLYSQGINQDGSRSNYGGNLSSSGILLSAAHYQIKKNIQLHVWNQLVGNIFNSVMLRSDYSGKPDDNNTILGSVQLIRQDAIHDGGNIDPTKSYFQKGSHSLSFGAMMGWVSGGFKTTLNFNRITAAGRYLMPREFGRDPFFTFLPRERNDGFGDVTAFMAQFSYQVGQFGTSVAAGYYHLPDVKNYALNKYGLPSYSQLNANLKYGFSGFAHGLDAELLFVYKAKKGNSYGLPGYEINKVDMLQGNLILNYYF